VEDGEEFELTGMRIEALEGQAPDIRYGFGNIGAGSLALVREEMEFELDIPAQLDGPTSADVVLVFEPEDRPWVVRVDRLEYTLNSKQYFSVEDFELTSREVC